MQIDLKSDFTLDDLLCVLEEQELQRSGFYTRREWGKILGVSGYKVSKLLHLAKDKGILNVTRHRRESIDGTIRPVQVYAFDVEKVNEDGA